MGVRISRILRGPVPAAGPGPAAVAERATAGAGRRAPGAGSRPAATGGGLEGLLRGRTLDGRYAIVEVIGRGGNGVVYRALDTRLEREVAVKVLAPRDPAAERSAFLRARFAREARTAAGIRHPNVVVVHDHGTDDELGLDYLVMELLEGGDLDTLVREFGLPRVKSTVGILRQAAAGVAAGHRAGLVHRDLKPANLFLETGGPPIRVKVLDFGIAQEDRPGEWTLATRGGETLHPLSPAFASPEQLRGDAWVSPASDVFSLGAVGYHLLTGERLWSSPDPNRALAEMEAARAALLQERALPLKLREAIAQALASHPQDRHPDARALLIALDSVRIDGHAAAAMAGPADVEAEPLSVGVAEPAAPAAPAPSARRRARSDAGVLEAIRISATAVVLAVVVALGYLAVAAGVWDTVAAALAVLAAATLIGGGRKGGRPLESAPAYALGLGGIVLLGGMLARVAAGSVADLLLAQVILSWIVPSIAASAPAGERSAASRERDEGW